MNPPAEKNGVVRLYQLLMDCLYIVTFPVCAVKVLGRWLGRGEPPLFLERLGRYSSQDLQQLAGGKNVWIHAASAGEVNAVAPLCQALKKARPSLRLVLTTTSATGRKLAREKNLADFVFLCPLDMTRPLRRAFSAFQPVALLVAETEFWPHLFFRANQSAVPVLLVNGRVSDRSFPRYRFFRGLFTPTLQCFTECLVQTEQDQEKLRGLGVPESRLKVAGQMKYDLSSPPREAMERFKGALGLQSTDVLFTLGSLREGEDDPVLGIIPALLALSSHVKVLAAPRHLKNAPLYAEKLRSKGVEAVLRSEMGKGSVGERVIVLDTLGELSLAYALSRCAFVGGTLVPIGGHNLMEPALASVPVCFGPFTGNVREAAQALLKGGGFQVQMASDLPGIFGKFLDREVFRQEGEKAYGAVVSMKGATERTVERILKYL